ncbi:MAG: hypothetical protein QM755_24180 [Luteolibacter sp.]
MTTIVKLVAVLMAGCCVVGCSNDPQAPSPQGPAPKSGSTAKSVSVLGHFEGGDRIRVTVINQGPTSVWVDRPEPVILHRVDGRMERWVTRSRFRLSMMASWSPLRAELPPAGRKEFVIRPVDYVVATTGRPVHYEPGKGRYFAEIVVDGDARRCPIEAVIANPKASGKVSTESLDVYLEKTGQVRRKNTDFIY